MTEELLPLKFEIMSYLALFHPLVAEYISSESTEKLKGHYSQIMVDELALM